MILFLTLFDKLKCYWFSSFIENNTIYTTNTIYLLFCGKLLLHGLYTLYWLYSILMKQTGDLYFFIDSLGGGR